MRTTIRQLWEIILDADTAEKRICAGGKRGVSFRYDISKHDFRVEDLGHFEIIGLANKALADVI